MIPTRDRAPERDDYDDDEPVGYDVTDVVPRPGTAVAPRRRFDLARWQKENGPRLARRAEVEQNRAALRLVTKVKAALAALGMAGFTAAELGADPLLAAGATGAVAGVAWLAGRLVVRPSPEWSATYRRAAVTGTAWAVTAPLCGWLWPLPAAALLLERVSTGWRQAHSLDRPAPDGPAPPAGLPPAPPVLALPVAADEGEVMRQKVLGRVTCPGGPFAGSRIARHDSHGGAHRFLLALPEGEYFRAVVDRRDLTAARLECQEGDVTLERHPGGAHLVVLTVTTRSALSQGVPYVGPRYEDGKIPIGPFKDGGDWASWVLKDRQGTRSGAIVGDPGGGKSTIAAHVLLGCRVSGEWRVLFTDGDPHAGSSPELAAHADWPQPGPDGAMEQLQAMEAFYTARSALIGTLTVDPDTGRLRERRRGERAADKILPCPDYPGHLWVLEEFRKFANDRTLERHNFVPRVETLVRDMRKYGGAVMAITHSMLSPDYGGGSILPNLLFGGNLFVCRIENPNEYATIDGITIQPNTLPRGGGYAYNIQSGRLMMLRAAYRDNLTEGIVLPPRIPADEPTTVALAPFWPARERDEETSYGEAVERYEVWRRAAEAALTQTQPPSGETAPASAPAPQTGVPELDALHWPNVLQFPAQPAPEPDVDPLLAAATADDRLNDTDRRVLAAVLGGSCRSYQIINATGLSASTVSKSAGKLAQHGYLVDGGYGKWAIPEAKAVSS